MKIGKRRAALMFGTPVLSVALLSGVAAAAFQPIDRQMSAYPERVEKARPPLPELVQILDRLVADGKITATQRDSILAAVKEHSDKQKSEQKSEEKSEQKSEQKMRIDVHKLLGDSLRSAIAYLGLESRAVQEQLRSGKSLAELATGAKTRAGLIAAISTPANTKIDELKGSGKLTEEQATKTRAQVAEAAAKIVDSKSNLRKVTPPGQAKRRP